MLIKINKTEDIWLAIKYYLRIPLPIRNHYYKWHRISMKSNYFCKKCHSVFHLKPWKKFKKINPMDMKCPNCKSESIIWSTNVFEAIINKQSGNELMEIIKKYESRDGLVEILGIIEKPTAHIV